MANTPTFLNARQIGDLCGVSRQAVNQWRASFKDFPKPDMDGRYQYWRASRIVPWLRKRGKLV